MNAITGNVMKMEHFHDFYFLEALQARLNMAKSANPELQFRRAVEKLESDINETFEKLTYTMAFRIYVYLYAAALGEARHANYYCEMAINELSGNDRNSVYSKAIQYFPNDENIQILTDVFEQSWLSCSFGGKAWLNIVEGMKLYGKVSNATFIDHAVDLHHNSGSVFTKQTQSLKFDCFGTYDSTSLQYFLDWKFEGDILNCEYWQNTDTMSTSTKVYNLIVRFSNIIETLNAIHYCKPRLEFLTPYTVDWGHKTYTMSDSESDWPECEWCDNKIDENDHYHYKDQCICDSCYGDLVYCEKCGELCKREETFEVDGETWCETCAESHSFQCENCGNLTQEYTITDDTDQTFCNDCIENNATQCECGDWVSDMDTHDKEKHPEPTKVIDWSLLTNVNQWLNLPSDTLDEIKKEICGG
jgi:hypothetical protein